jgi:hypothetical protein
MDALLGRLQSVKPSGGGWSARCPAHDDHRNSLSVSEGVDGKILIYCHAGCSTEEVVAHLGMTMADLGSPNGQRRRDGGDIVATYDYQDESGKLLYQAVRLHAKDFRMRRPLAGGEWEWKMEGTRRVLYRLPKLVKAVKEGQRVFVVEGEKDVDALVDRGFVSTTNPNGAGKWRAEYAQVLAGAYVALIPDNDEPGRRHMEEVAQSLHGVAAQVRWVELPGLDEKEDVSDWFNAGGSADELNRLVQQASLWEPSEGCTHEDSERQDNHEEVECGLAHAYRETDHGIVWDKPSRNGIVPVLLANFTARIVAETEYDDGQEIRREFDIEVSVRGRRRQCQVKAADFALMRWPIEQLGADTIVYPGSTLREHARVAIQLLSGAPKRRQVYTHTGWREIDGENYYLHAGGAISARGNSTDVCVSLEGSLSHYCLVEPRPDVRAAVCASLKLIDAAPLHITIPLLAGIYRAPLGEADFGIALVGPTGSGKSELAALVQQHYGAQMTSRRLPGSWSSTANALESMAFLVKDAILTIDDFAPGGGSGFDRSHQDMDRVLRGQGNLSGRHRARPDGSLRQARRPRGLILSTGEDVARGQSLNARMANVWLDSSDVDWKVMTELQKEAAQGLLAASMWGYVAWLAPEYGPISQDRLREYREQASHQGGHRRVPDIIGHLALGLERFLDFAVAVKALTAQERSELWNQGWDALMRMGAAQETLQRSSDPVDRFFELLRSALISGRAHLASMAGVRPSEDAVAVACGYERRDDGTWLGRGEQVGWVDNDGNTYLDSDAAFKVAQGVARDTNHPLAVQQATLRRLLRDRGSLISTDSTRGRLTVRLTIDGVRREVLHVSTTVIGVEIEQ